MTRVLPGFMLGFFIFFKVVHFGIVFQLSHLACDTIFEKTESRYNHGYWQYSALKGWKIWTVVLRRTVRER